MPQFSIKLAGPTSTSKELCVAVNFADEDGIIIEFDNARGNVAQSVRGMDVSFISRYGGQEDERYK